MVETVPFLDFLQTIGVLATLIFVLTSMLGMGFSLVYRWRNGEKDRNNHGMK